MTEQFVTYFGYGSLVNRYTRPAHEVAFPARLYGWKRVWGHRVNASVQTLSDSIRTCCSLSIVKCDVVKCDEKHDKSHSNPANTNVSNDQYIDGVIVNIPLVDLSALDSREAGYDRLKIPATEFDLPPHCVSEHIHVYVSDQIHSGRSSAQFPILQSYVDCVLAGYCAVFEHEGMQHFVDSTNGWNGTIENERSNPRYPRAVQLPDSQLALFDHLLSSHRSN